MDTLSIMGANPLIHINDMSIALMIIHNSSGDRLYTPFSLGSQQIGVSNRHNFLDSPGQL